VRIAQRIAEAAMSRRARSPSPSVFASVRRRRFSRTARRAEESRRFLEQASALLASSLEVDATFDHIARLVVPFLADWCIIDMAGDARSVRTLAVAHHDPAREPLLREMVRRYSPNPQAPSGTARVL